jgi:hypothetical protein
MAIDTGLIGSVINALPIDRMIAAPLNAMINAQISASRQYADFITGVCINSDGKAKMVQFDYEETLVDAEGNYKGVVQKTMRIPLLAAVTHPNINVEEGSVEFELEVSQSEETHEETAGEASFQASLGWGPFKVSMSGKVSQHKEQTRSTDTRAKYSFHTSLKRSGPPEGMMRVIDFLTEAATKPTQIKADQHPDPKTLPDPKANVPIAATEAAKEKQNPPQPHG